MNLIMEGVLVDGSLSDSDLYSAHSSTVHSSHFTQSVGRARRGVVFKWIKMDWMDLDG